MSGNWDIGDRIENRWEIYNILHGGMGIVYIVYDHELHEAFAVKTFRDDIFAQNPGIADRFEKEATAWVNLDIHQNVVEARFVQTILDRPFLFLEYVNGGDLDSWIGSPRLTEDLPQVLLFAIQLCDGMIHALSKGINVHRDIKPKNCLVTQDNILKVTDFGLAKVFEDVRIIESGEGRQDEDEKLHRLSINLSRTGAGAGSPPYMAPEQFDDAKHVATQADIYSFGITLFEMVEGRLPFDVSSKSGRSKWGEFERAQKNEPPPALVASMPLELCAAIHKCLSKNPEERFGNFSSVREVLADIYESVTEQRAPQPPIGEQLTANRLSTKGASLGELGRHKEAIACFDEVLKINHDHGEAWSNKGVALDSLGLTDKAIECYDQAIRINPDHSRAHYNKGATLHKMGGDHYQEISCYNRALEIDPFCTEAWCNKGVALCFLGQPEEAIPCYDRAIKLKPSYALAHLNKGIAQRDLGNYEDAISSCDRTIEINQRLAIAWYEKGVTLTKLKRFRKALHSFKMADSLGSRDAIAGIVLCKRELDKE